MLDLQRCYAFDSLGGSRGTVASIHLWPLTGFIFLAMSMRVLFICRELCQIWWQKESGRDLSLSPAYSATYSLVKEKPNTLGAESAK